MKCRPLVSLVQFPHFLSPGQFGAGAPLRLSTPTHSSMMVFRNRSLCEEGVGSAAALRLDGVSEILLTRHFVLFVKVGMLSRTNLRKMTKVPL